MVSVACGGGGCDFVTFFSSLELNFIGVLVLRDDMFLAFAYNLRPKVDISGERV